MSLFETIVQNGPAIAQMAQQLGIGQGDAQKAVGALLPALSRGVSRNAQQPGGLESLLGALGTGSHERYYDDARSLGAADTVQDGNAILGHILGSKDVSRNVAGHAASETGLDSGILKKMLPMVAALAMGALTKQSSAGGQLQELAGRGAESTSLLETFLDSDRDGSIADDLLNLAQRFF